MLSLLRDWRYRLTFAWYDLDKGKWAFVAILALPFALLPFLIYTVHQDYRRAAAERGRRAELRCLAENVYYEARGEPLEGQYAVAEVTMNRLRSRLFASTVCEVVHQKRYDAPRRQYVAAFSWTELGPLPQPRAAPWRQALDVAMAVYDDQYSPRVPNALYYHAIDVVPSWASERRRIAQIGSHVFYR